jgi:hypothetical protein
MTSITDGHMGLGEEAPGFSSKSESKIVSKSKRKRKRKRVSFGEVAERGGFEPPVGF